MPQPLDAETRDRLQRAPLAHDAAVRVDMPAPPGFWRLEQSRRLGPVSLDAAYDTLASWRMHEDSGFDVHVSSRDVAVDTVLTLTTRVGPLRVVAPCRIVRVVDEEHRCGFVYGTLPGHPVRGEEEFVVSRSDDGDVVATIAAVSQPASLLARLGSPVTRSRQRRIADDYLAAWVQLVDAPRT